jgi:two-component system nitrate/nitrite response regulator NarL
MNILLVDDEHISNFINKKLIEHIDASINTTAFNDPEEAFDQLDYLKPDLVFLDINMPVMNGWDFLDRMITEQVDYKVIILTSSVNSIDHRRAMKYMNVIGYIEKPATITNITPYISQLLVAVA